MLVEHFKVVSKENRKKTLLLNAFSSHLHFPIFLHPFIIILVSVLETQTGLGIKEYTEHAF